MEFPGIRNKTAIPNWSGTSENLCTEVFGSTCFSVTFQTFFQFPHWNFQLKMAKVTEIPGVMNKMINPNWSVTSENLCTGEKRERNGILTARFPRWRKVWLSPTIQFWQRKKGSFFSRRSIRKAYWMTIAKRGRKFASLSLSLCLTGYDVSISIELLCWLLLSFFAAAGPLFGVLLHLPWAFLPRFGPTKVTFFVHSGPFGG